MAVSSEDPHSKACEETSDQKGVCPSWLLEREKNAIVLGTWDDCAFQVSLKGRGCGEDPLGVPLFNELLPYHCLPHCGVYGPDDYHIALPLAIVVLPSETVVCDGLSALPAELQQLLREKPVPDSSLMDVSILLHSLPCFEGSLDPGRRELNLLFHMWALQGLDIAGEEVHISLEVGVFGGDGVRETAQDICEELNGAPVDRTGPRILHMHALCFSPHNSQLQLLENRSLHSFFSFGRHSDGRTAITYHIVPSTEEVEKQFKQILKTSKTVGDLIDHFAAVKNQIPGLSRTLTAVNHLFSVL